MTDWANHCSQEFILLETPKFRRQVRAAPPFVNLAILGAVNEKTCDVAVELSDGWPPVSPHLSSSALSFVLAAIDVIQALWSGLSDARLLEYHAATPPEWSAALPAVNEAPDRVRDARDNFNGVVAEVKRVLK